jgi:hypothetical protein
MAFHPKLIDKTKLNTNIARHFFMLDLLFGSGKDLIFLWKDNSRKTKEKGSQGIKIPRSLSYGHFLDSPFHTSPRSMGLNKC